jgi:hypothetical protein
MTDILPTELSELFTYKFFYEYLLNKDDEIKFMIEEIIKLKNNSSGGTPFLGSINWTTIPLKYNIMKSSQSSREISLLQPMAAIELFLFVSSYQKELLNTLDKNSIYSMRYHTRNNDLCYKNKNKAITQYFSEESRKAKRDIIEHTGMFFNIKPYKSIASFTSSEEWFMLNSKYKYFVRTDYKACFDSIYTHTYKWLVGKDVNDTKEFKNSNIYTVIDRVLQNINSRTSNGIVVGPEFSRMIAEVLLQGIDVTVNNNLLNEGFQNGENYYVCRYVDDIFIYADSEELIDRIVELYSEVSNKYLLHLNENKLYKTHVPFVLDMWLNDTNLFVNRVSNILFNSKEEQKDIVTKLQASIISDQTLLLKAYIFKDSMFGLMKSSLMKQFNKLICDYEDKNRTIVAYFMGMILNKVKRNKDKVTIFRENISSKVIYNFLDFIFYIYSFYPDYNNTQRLLSIISYVRDEFDIFAEYDILQKLVNKYSFIFEKSNLNDIINLIIICGQAKTEIPFKQETIILESLRKKDDPILWASYLIYAKYNSKYFSEIQDEICGIIKERMDAIICKESTYTYREFWWLIVFNKSPYIGITEQTIFDGIANDLKVSANPNKTAGELCGDLFIDFLRNSPIQFFEWDIENRDFLRDITFKTYERTIFKNYRENLNYLYWGSF